MKIVASNSLTLSNVNDGTITHTAYAYSADGTDRFTTVYPNLNLLTGTKTTRSITGNNTVNQYGLLYSFDNNSTLKNQGFSINDTVTLEFDWSATNPASGTFVLQWQGQPWVFSVPTINLSSTNGSGHVKHTFNIRAVDIASTAVATGIGYRLDNIPTNTVITFSNAIISKTKTSQPYMQSSSEVTTADWPKYIGRYTDFMQADSTNPSDYTWGPMRGDDGKPGAKGDKGALDEEQVKEITDKIDTKADSELTQEQINALNEKNQILESEMQAKASMEAFSEFEKTYQSFVKANKDGQAKAEADLIKAGRRIELLTTQFGGLAELKTFIDTYMLSSNEGLIIGKNDASSIIKVSSDRISMFSAGKEVMYISQGVININNGIFTTSIQIGKFRTEQYHLNADMNVIRYVGG